MHVFSRYLACFWEVLLAFQFITACSLLINGEDFSWTQPMFTLRRAGNKQMTYFTHFTLCLLQEWPTLNQWKEFFIVAPCILIYKVVQIWPGLICVYTSRKAQQLCDLERVKPQYPPSLQLGLEPVQSCLGVARVMSNYGYKKKSFPVIFEPPCMYSSLTNKCTVINLKNTLKFTFKYTYVAASVF